MKRGFVLGFVSCFLLITWKGEYFAAKIRPLTEKLAEKQEELNLWTREQEYNQEKEAGL